MRMKILKPDSDDELMEMFIPIMSMPRGTPVRDGAARVLTRISRLLAVAILTIAEEVDADADDLLVNAEETLKLMREQVMDVVRIEANDMMAKKKGSIH